jgi:hypothetical protein
MAGKVGAGATKNMGCLRSLLSSAFSVGGGGSSSSVSTKTKRSVVLSSAQRSGHVVSPNNPNLVRGEGCVLATSSCEQDLCCFEVKIVELGDFSVGVARQSQDPVNEFKARHLGTTGSPGWGLSTAKLESAGRPFAPGDVIGVFVDQTSAPKLSFTVNGKQLGPEFSLPGRLVKAEEIRGQLYPAGSVSNGAVLEFVFEETKFKHISPQDSFKAIIPVREML